jgi:hypothetical protein
MTLLALLASRLPVLFDTRSMGRANGGRNAANAML